MNLHLQYTVTYHIASYCKGSIIPRQIYLPHLTVTGFSVQVGLHYTVIVVPFFCIIMPLSIVAQAAAVTSRCKNGCSIPAYTVHTMLYDKILCILFCKRTPA